MDAATISAFAAATAAAGAFTVAGVQLYVGYRQSKAALTAASAALTSAESTGRHTVAEFRQKWIDNVIDAFCDYYTLLMAIGDGTLSLDENRRLTTLRARLEILLNPDEEYTVSLLALADSARQASTAAERDATAREMVQVARKLLKAEWVRIKSELQ